MKEIEEDINKWKDIPFMLMDWESQYCKNLYNAQSNLQIRCNPYQNAHGLFQRNKTNNPKFI